MFALLLATAATTPDALSLSGAGGTVLSVDEDRTGNALSAARLAGARLQVDHTYTRRFFAGGVLGYESIYGQHSHLRTADVALVGGVLGARWGDVVRGGFRVGAGFAYGFATLRTPLESNVRSPGWFLDVEGELSVRLNDRFEVFANVPLVLYRTFYVREDDVRARRWWYAVPLIPLAGNLGVRVRF